MSHSIRGVTAWLRPRACGSPAGGATLDNESSKQITTAKVTRTPEASTPLLLELKVRSKKRPAIAEYRWSSLLPQVTLRGRNLASRQSSCGQPHSYRLTRRTLAPKSYHATYPESAASSSRSPKGKV